ncbi:MAG: DUF4157 domain-containing protein [Acidimicrobiales bacterium]
MGSEREMGEHVIEEPRTRPHAPATARTGVPGAFATLQSVQALAGNQATNALLAAAQPKLEVGPAGDRYEREADAVARQVVNAITHGAQAGPSVAHRGSDHSIQRRPEVGARGGDVDPHTESMLRRSRSGGQPLPRSMRRPMEEAFGTDFSAVRIHAGASAQALNRQLGARAFTLGTDIFFGGPAPYSASRANQELLAHELTHVVQQAAPQPAVVRRKDKKPKVTYDEVDGRQYRVYKEGGERKVQQVMRTTDDDGNVVYVAIGEVERFEDRKPVLTEYDVPRPLYGPDGKTPWYPAVTHLNGMAVAPESGINSAKELKDHIDDALGNKDDVALSQDGVDILYSYSAKRSNFVADLYDCIKGKVQVVDDSTRNQQNIMLDAVRQKHRTTVSAHSRGTIKTDNAVRNVHKALSTKDFKPDAAASLSGGGKKPKASEVKKEAERLAAQAMDQYIQLIYAGNAVQYPSSVLKIEMFSRRGDFVSMGAGSYTGWGARASGAPKGTKMHGGSGGHGFVENYAKDVGKTIAADIKNR